MRRGLWFFALLLAACGGGGGHSSMGSAVPAPATSGTATTAVFTIAVPSRTAASQTRAPKYVSVSTQSAIVALTTVNGSPYTGSPASTATNLTPSSSSCAMVNATLTCTVTAPAVVGTDTFTVTTYDAQQPSASPATPSGNLLSQAVLSLNVTAGSANQPPTPLILGGVPASYTASFPTDAHVRGTQTAGYQIAGNWAYTLTVTPFDADGNVIIGVGTPQLTVQSATSAVSVTPGSANTFTVAAKTYSATPVTLTIGATAGASTTVGVTTVQELWVTNSSANTVTAYALWPAIAPALLPETISASGPTGIAFDPNNNLWVANRGSLKVNEYLAGGVTPGTIINAQSTQITFDAAGDLWRQDNLAIPGGNLFEYTPPITTTPARVVSAGDLPFGIALDSAGNVWASSFDGAGLITKYAAPNYTASATINDTNNPYGLAFDSSQNLWVANNFTGQIVAYAPPYTGAPVTTVPIVGFPIGIAFDLTGNLWVANGVNAIEEYTPPAYGAGTTISDAGGPFFMAFTP